MIKTTSTFLLPVPLHLHMWNHHNPWTLGCVQVEIHVIPTTPMQM